VISLNLINNFRWEIITDEGGSVNLTVEIRAGFLNYQSMELSRYIFTTYFHYIETCYHQSEKFFIVLISPH
jgi:hypothetical protein